MLNPDLRGSSSGRYLDIHGTERDMTTMFANTPCVELALSKIPGAIPNLIFARSESISTEHQLIGRGMSYVYPDTPYPYLSAAQIVTVSSDSASDVADTSGAYTVKITGLNADWELTSEVVSLNGQTAVSTVNSYIRVLLAEVVTCANPYQGAVGNIYVGYGTVTSGVPANILQYIEAMINRSQAGIYTIPAGYKGIVYQVSYGVEEDKTATFNAFLRSNNVDDSPFINTFAATMTGDTLIRTLPVPTAIPEKTDIEFRASVSVSNTAVSVTLDLNLIKEDTYYVK